MVVVYLLICPTVMGLPMSMLRSLQLRTTAKIGLAGVFSCAFITIIFDVTRAIETVRNDGTVGSTALWTNLESAVAVIVSCLPSFKALLGPRRSSDPARTVSHYKTRPLTISKSARTLLGDGPSFDSGMSTPLTGIKQPDADHSTRSFSLGTGAIKGTPVKGISTV